MRAAAVTLALAGCFHQPAFHCDQSSDCATPGALCQPVGFCSFPDPSCSSGQRFGDLSGPFANACVDPGDAIDGGIDSSRAIDAGPDAPPPLAVRINIAGPAYSGVDHPGEWTADPGVNGACDGMEFDSPTQVINTTNDSALYRTQMFGTTLNCHVDVPAGTYQVTLLFAELRLGPAPCTATGNRVFSIALEGNSELADFDLTTEGGGCAAQGGAGHPVDKTFTVTVSDGTLDVQETASAGAAVLNAIELVGTP